jgi:hypothetical protein
MISFLKRHSLPKRLDQNTEEILAKRNVAATARMISDQLTTCSAENPKIQKCLEGF